jgi:hypothetical protein
MDGVTYPPPPEGRGARPRAPDLRWETVQHLYTVNPNRAPPPHTLLVGELGLELADPMKAWVGVPTDMDPTGRKLLYTSSTVHISSVAPASPQPGQLWFDSVNAQTYLWYDDGTSAQWVVVVAQNVPAPVIISDAPPPSPKPGQLWFDTVNAQTYIWYDDGTSAQWVIAVAVESVEGPPGPAGPPGPIGPAGSGYVLPVASTTVLGGVKVDGSSIIVTGTGVISSPGGGGGSGFPDGPLDGLTYGRKMAAWERVIAASNDVVDGGNF